MKLTISLLLNIALATSAPTVAACAPRDATARGTSSDAAIASISTAALDSLSSAADRGRVQGSPSATVWVVEVSDLQCPFCKDWHDEVYPKIVNEFVKTGKIRLAFVNFPLAQHKNAKPAAVAAMCAGAQDKFWPMHDAMFAAQPKWETLDNPTSFFEGLATKAGVNVSAWRSCLSSTTVNSLIEADMDRARRVGVQSTPSFIVGGKLVEGAVPFDEFRKLINDAVSGGK